MGKCTDHLTVDERNAIHRCLNQGLSQRAMARWLDRPPSAVSREIRRKAVGRHTMRDGPSRRHKHSVAEGPESFQVDTPLFAEVRALMNRD